MKLKATISIIVLVIGKNDVIAVVTLQTFYLGKFNLLTVYLGKLDFKV